MLLGRKGLMREKNVWCYIAYSVDVFGLLHAMFVSTASVADCEGVILLVGCLLYC